MLVYTLTVALYTGECQYEALDSRDSIGAYFAGHVIETQPRHVIHVAATWNREQSRLHILVAASVVVRFLAFFP